MSRKKKKGKSSEARAESGATNERTPTKESNSSVRTSWTDQKGCSPAKGAYCCRDPRQKPPTRTHHTTSLPNPTTSHVLLDSSAPLHSTQTSGIETPQRDSIDGKEPKTEHKVPFSHPPSPKWHQQKAL